MAEDDYGYDLEDPTLDEAARKIQQAYRAAFHKNVENIHISRRKLEELLDSDEDDFEQPETKRGRLEETAPVEVAARVEDVAPVEETRQTMATHQVLATFVGTYDQPCRFMTSLCPNQCNHGGPVAEFQIEQYYSMTPGDYVPTDATTVPQQEGRFVFSMKEGRPTEENESWVYDVVNGLNPGDKVDLTWVHDVVSGNNGSGPRRRVTQLQRRDDVEMTEASTESAVETAPVVEEVVTETVTETVTEPVQETVTEPVQETVTETVEEPAQETVVETVQETAETTEETPEVEEAPKKKRGGRPKKQVVQEEEEQEQPIEEETLTETGRQTIATHSVKATLQGIRTLRCRLRTALCPNQCNHGGPVATFKIDEYRALTPGDYVPTDDTTKPVEETTFAFRAVVDKKEGINQNVVDTVNSLQPGDEVYLTWVHDYVEQTDSNGGKVSGPVRGVTELTKIEA